MNDHVLTRTAGRPDGFNHDVCGQATAEAHPQLFVGRLELVTAARTHAGALGALLVPFLLPLRMENPVNCEPNYKGHNAIVARDVLDHGFVALRNISGPTRRAFDTFDNGDHPNAIADRTFDADDVDIAQAARMSFNQMDSTRTREQDLKLADYLMRNAHWSPFEMVSVWLEMKMPIFVARQFVRHDAHINEVSARYTQLPAEWYIPTVVGGKSADKKQGQDDNLNETEQHMFRVGLNQHCRRGYADYEAALKHGVAPEHARMFLSVNHYTYWLWNQNLRDLLIFLKSRMHEHAQIEARAYANSIYDMLRQYLPATMDLFDKYLRQQ